MNGGEIEVTGGKYSAGIGGGLQGHGGNITINDGKVTATGGGRYASMGIGGGMTWRDATSGNGGTITVNEVQSMATEWAAAISAMTKELSA
ncbi:MAG: hypothetical protein IJG51_05485 [Synergistaceae bacterium]|nr:hypothetical protein [Synergistaceae bacterium]MBQ3398318.1 hypothetical protein [Synergistaceae bacterium]MBQ6982591.1 hypothetical protein [Synergistaceae bacterium]MBR0247872.1 hypothetical protein [Synergistaceae bacterium]